MVVLSKTILSFYGGVNVPLDSGFWVVASGLRIVELCQTSERKNKSIKMPAMLFILDNQ